MKVKWIFLLIVAAIALTWGGVQDLLTSVANRQPAKMTCAEYLQTKPNAEWLELDQCRLFMIEMSVQKKLSQITKLYIPVGPANEEKISSIHILFATTDPELLSLAREMEKAEKNANPVDFLKKNIERLFVKRKISGLIQSGLRMKSKVRSKLARNDDKLTTDFVVLADGEKPEAVVAVMMLASGLTCAGVLIFLLFFRKASPPSAGPGATPPPVMAAPPRLP